MNPRRHEVNACLITVVSVESFLLSSSLSRSSACRLLPRKGRWCRGLGCRGSSRFSLGSGISSCPSATRSIRTALRCQEEGMLLRRRPEDRPTWAMNSIRMDRPVPGVSSAWRKLVLAAGPAEDLRAPMPADSDRDPEDRDLDPESLDRDHARAGIGIRTSGNWLPIVRLFPQASGESAAILGTTMRTQSPDTSPKIEAFLIEAYRRMTPGEKLLCVMDLNRTAQALAESRIRATYGPEISEREVRLRLASLWLDRKTMIKAFGWDPEVEGY